MKLSYKFIFIFISTSLFILLLMFFVLNHMAYRNFSVYVNQIEIKILDDHAALLGEEYDNHSGWDHLKKNMHRFRIVLRPLAIGRGPDAARQAFSPQAHGFQPPPPPGGPAFDPLQIMPRLTLFDSKKHHVVGGADFTDGHILKAITVNGKTVGWLGLKTQTQFYRPMDIEFLNRQKQSFYITGVLILIVTALVALMLARHTLSPIKQLIRGTRAIKSRNFKTRISVRSGDELGQLASDFNSMARTLEKSEQMQKQWISDIAHELRTPLSIIQGEIEAIQDGVREASPLTMSSLHTETLRLVNIVNDLNDIFLAESGAVKYNKVPVDPVFVLKETMSLFKKPYSENQISILDNTDKTSGHKILGDGGRLSQLFSNLFDNTLKYTDSPGELKISLSSSKNDLSFVFEDTAPGVPDEDLPHLFDRLYRVDSSRSRIKGGSGLGLSICKHIVETHDGIIEASHSSLGGLKIKITLALHL